MMRFNTYKVYAALTALYIIVIFAIPPNPLTMEAYHLTPAAYRTLLIITLAIPSVVTWFAAFYGYEQFRRYTDIVKDTKEGPIFNKISEGLAWIALSLPVVSILGLTLSGIANRAPGFRPAAVVISNYIMLILALIAFTTMSKGARQAANLVKTRPSEFATKSLMFLFICLGTFYCYLLIHSTDNGLKPYYLPVGLLLVSVIIPYLFAWFSGMLAALDIHAYASKSRGLIYKKAMNLFAAGILTIVGSSILLQYINSASTQNNRTVLGGLLIVRYLLFGFFILGFYFIAKSANKLQQIEKI